MDADPLLSPPKPPQPRSHSFPSFHPVCPAPFPLLEGETQTLLSPAHNSRVSGLRCIVFDSARAGKSASAFLTNFRLVVKPDDPNYLQDRRLRRDFLTVPWLTIKALEAGEDFGHSTLALETKDGRLVALGFIEGDWEKYRLLAVIRSMVFPASPRLQFAFNHRQEGLVNGWNVYDQRVEYARFGVIENCLAASWVYMDNYGGQICDSYPDTLVVPKSLSVTEVQEIATFRAKGRLPVLVWAHPKQISTLWRSSQPRTGITKARCPEDEKLLREILSSCCLSRKLALIDARPFLNAQVNRATGGGVEPQAAYDFLEITFLNIPNIHAVRQSFESMQNCANLPASQFLSSIEKAGWMELVSKLLSGSMDVAARLLAGQSVLVHCSDGWDRTAQICSLTQLLVDSYYRTLKGFAVLIEKDWVTAGHQFALRFGHGNGDTTDNQRSPVFLLFLDCVYQLCEQFPTAFEFTERLLLDLADWTWNCRFGTFLFNSHQARLQQDAYRQTTSVWTYVFSQAKDYCNPFYAQTQDSLRPSATLRRLKPWTGLFFRWHPDFFYAETGFVSAAIHQEMLMRQTCAGAAQLKTRLEGS